VQFAAPLVLIFVTCYFCLIDQLSDWLNACALRLSFSNTMTSDVLSTNRQLFCKLCVTTIYMGRSRILLEYEHVSSNVAHRWLQMLCQHHVSIILAVYFCSWVNKFIPVSIGTTWNMGVMVKNKVARFLWTTVYSDATIYRPNDISSRYWPYRIVSISSRKISKFQYIVIVSILF